MESSRVQGSGFRVQGRAPCSALDTSEPKLLNPEPRTLNPPVRRASLFRRLHRDTDGTISILSVFAVLLLTILLGMVMNVGRHVDGKIRMQNAADAAAYSGGVVLARGMNTLAFTNHLLSDVFALTAFMREAKYGNSAEFTDRILAAWSPVGAVLTTSGLPKFDALGRAIIRKIPLEQDLVDTYSEWSRAVSARVLPVLEEILADELIPKYQRAVAATFPDMAQAVVLEIAARHGRSDYRRGRMLGALWRTSGVPVGGGFELESPSLDVVDPVLGTGPNMDYYRDTAIAQRERLARRYLDHWNRQSLSMFDHEAKMCQFGALWRSFTCGYLKELLEDEYPDVNLPFVIRGPGSEGVAAYCRARGRSSGGACGCKDPPADEAETDPNAYLNEHFTFVAVVYWDKLPEMMPGLFRSPIEADPQAYAELRVFVPTARLVWQHVGPGCAGGGIPVGGVPGDYPDLGGGGEPAPGDDAGVGYWTVGRQRVSTEWTLLNQHWTCQLVPCTQRALPVILSTPPPLPEFLQEDIVYPELYDVDGEEIGRISSH